ncbi:unnamed protein product, partial [Didymodactylos carnosus]
HNDKRTAIKNELDAYSYLNKFGYDSCKSKNKNGIDKALCSTDMKSMIKHYQTVFHLPVSGKLDEKTLKLMNKPRCGISDYPLSYVSYKPWNKKTFTWRLNTQNAPFGSRARAIMQNSFQDWARYTSLSFREVCSTCDADFKLAFATGDHRDGFPFDGQGKYNLTIAKNEKR